MDKLLVLLTIMACIGLGQAIKCYSCSYDEKHPDRNNGTGCREAFHLDEHVRETDCLFMCFKTRSGSGPIWQRGCMQNCESTRHRWCCRGHLCNTGTTARISIGLIAMVTASKLLI